MQLLLLLIVVSKIALKELKLLNTHGLHCKKSTVTNPTRPLSAVRPLQPEHFHRLFGRKHPKKGLMARNHISKLKDREKLQDPKQKLLKVKINDFNWS